MVVFLAAGGGGNQAHFTASAFGSGTAVTAAMAATTAPSDSAFRRCGPAKPLFPWFCTYS